MLGGEGKWKRRCCSFAVCSSDLSRPCQLAGKEPDQHLNVKPLGEICLLTEMVLLNVIPFLPVIEPIPFHMLK